MANGNGRLKWREWPWLKKATAISALLVAVCSLIAILTGWAEKPARIFVQETVLAMDLPENARVDSLADTVKQMQNRLNGQDTVLAGIARAQSELQVTQELTALVIVLSQENLSELDKRRILTQFGLDNLNADSLLRAEIGKR